MPIAVPTIAPIESVEARCRAVALPIGKLHLYASRHSLVAVL